VAQRWSFVAAGTTATGANPAPALPAGYLPGDLLIVVAASTTAYSSTPPAGWLNAVRQIASPMQAIWYRFAQTTSESAPTLTNAGTTSVAVMLAYRNVDAVDVAAVTTTGTSTSPATTNTATTTHADDLVLSLYAVTSGTVTTWTAPGSTNSRSNIAPTAALTGLLLVDEDQAAAGATTARTATLGSSLAWDAAVVTFTSSGGLAPEDPWDWGYEEFPDEYWIPNVDEDDEVEPGINAPIGQYNEELDRFFEDIGTFNPDWSEAEWDLFEIALPRFPGVTVEDAWDWSIDDTRLDDDEWILRSDEDDEVEPGVNAPVAQYQDEWPFDAIDDTGAEWSEAEWDLFNSSGPNTKVFSPEDAWEWSLEGVPLDDEEWLVRIDEDDAVEPATVLGFPYSDEWDWEGEPADELWMQLVDEDDPVGDGVNFCRGAVLLQHYEPNFVTSNPLYCALPVNAQLGNVIICGITVRGTTDPGAPTPTDTVGGGTWLLATDSGATTGAVVEHTAVWYMVDTTGSGHSASWTFSGSFKGYGFIQEWAGVSTTNPFDGALIVNLNYTASGASPLVVSPFISRTQQNELAILQFGLYESNGTSPDSGLRVPAGWKTQYLQTDTNSFDGIVYAYIPNINAFTVPGVTLTWTQNGSDTAQVLLSTWKLNSPCAIFPDEWNWEEEPFGEEWLVRINEDDAVNPVVFPTQPPEDAWDWSVDPEPDDEWWTAERNAGAPPPIQWVQSVGNSSGTASTNITINNVVAGDTIVVFALESGSGALSVSDAQGPYAQVTSIFDAGVGGTEAIFVLFNANAGTHVITVSGVGATITGGVVSEYSGVVGHHGGHANTQSAPGTGVGAVTSGAVAGAVYGDTIVGFSLFGTNTLSPASGALRSNIFLTSIEWTMQEDQVFSGANGAATFTDSAGTQAFGTSAIALFPAPAAGLQIELEWAWEEDADDEWSWAIDDSATLAAVPIVSSQPPDPEWIEEDPDDDTTWWVDEPTANDNETLARADDWDWSEPDDDEWSWALEDYVPVNYIAPNPAEDVFPWDEEESDESWWIEDDSGQDVEYVAPNDLTDAWAWDVDPEPDDEWSLWLDDFAEEAVYPQPPEDAWDFAGDPEPDDEWWVGVDDSGLQQNSVLQPAVTAEDVYPWDEEEDLEPWWQTYDDSNILVGQPPPPMPAEDAWDWEEGTSSAEWIDSDWDLFNVVGNSTSVGTAFAWWNPSDKAATISLSNGNLTATTTSSVSQVRSTISVNNGKWYWEIHVDLNTARALGIGIARATSSLTTFPGGDATSWAYYSLSAGQTLKYNNGVGALYGIAYFTGDTIGVALDMDAGTLTFYVNGVSQGTAYSGLSGAMYAVVGSGGLDSQIATANFGQTPFRYSVPTGFNPGLYSLYSSSLEESWPWEVDPEPDDEAWFVSYDDSTAMAALPAGQILDEAWDWAYEETEDEVWWTQYDDAASVQYALLAPANGPEDAFPWEEGDGTGDDDWAGSDWDLFGTLGLPQPLPIEDPWDWGYEETEDEWAWGIDDSATLAPPPVAPPIPEDAWDWDWVEPEEDLTWIGIDDQPTVQYVAPIGPDDAWDWACEEVEDEWLWAIDDSETLQPPPAAPPIPEDSWDWVPDDNDDDAWFVTYDDATNVQYGNLLPGLVPEDSWDWTYEEVEDESWWQIDDATTVQAPAPAVTTEDPWDWAFEEIEDEWTWAIDDTMTVGDVWIVPEDAWDWSFEETEDEWGWAIDDSATLAVPPVPGITAEDVYPWDEEEEDDHWWQHQDDTSQQNAGVPAPGGPEDAWDWTIEETEDDFWHGVSEFTPADVAPPAPAALDPRTVARRKREKLGVKWGVDDKAGKEIYEAAQEPPKPPKDKKPARAPAQPSGLLLKLLGGAGIGKLEPPPAIKPRAPGPAEGPKIEEKVARPPGKAQPVVPKPRAPGPAPDPEKEALRAAADAARAQVAALQAEIERITAKLAGVERAMEVELDEARKLADHHAGEARAAEKETTRQLAIRVEEARAAEEELRKTRNNLLAIQAAMEIFFAPEPDEIEPDEDD
jgi:hypothetical protein